MAINRGELVEYVTAFKRGEPHRGTPVPEGVDWNKDPEDQTDKDRVKIVPCTMADCARPLIVSTFYVPAWAKCAACKGEQSGAGGGHATVAVPQPGRTPPEKAVNLADTLINPSFGHAVCPLDAEHTMELKSVTHNQNYGPSRLVGYDKKSGAPTYRNDVGETVMHQCNDCRVTVSYSTVHQMVYRRQNEPRTTAGDPSVYESLLGRREGAVA